MKIYIILFTLLIQSAHAVFYNCYAGRFNDVLVKFSIDPSSYTIYEHQISGEQMWFTCVGTNLGENVARLACSIQNREQDIIHPTASTKDGSETVTISIAKDKRLYYIGCIREDVDNGDLAFIW